jgi:hypothetical protein
MAEEQFHYVNLQLSEGKLGLKLLEVDDLWCQVVGVSGQAEKAGFLVGDCITDIGKIHIPESVSFIKRNFILCSKILQLIPILIFVSIIG